MYLPLFLTTRESETNLYLHVLLFYQRHAIQIKTHEHGGISMQIAVFLQSVQ